jgi:hypothetical protein
LVAFAELPLHPLHLLHHLHLTAQAAASPPFGVAALVVAVIVVRLGSFAGGGSPLTEHRGERPLHCR